MHGCELRVRGSDGCQYYFSNVPEWCEGLYRYPAIQLRKWRLRDPVRSWYLGDLRAFLGTNPVAVRTAAYIGAFASTAAANCNRGPLARLCRQASAPYERPESGRNGWISVESGPILGPDSFRRTDRVFTRRQLPRCRERFLAFRQESWLD